MFLQISFVLLLANAVVTEMVDSSSVILVVGDGDLPPTIPETVSALHDAITGNSDTIAKKKIVDTFAKASPGEVVAIHQKYANDYGKGQLIAKLQSKNPDDFSKIAVALAMTPAKFEAFKIHQSLSREKFFGSKTGKTGVKLVFEALLLKSNAEIDLIKQEYNKGTNNQLVKVVSDKILKSPSGDLGLLVNGMVTITREGNSQVNDADVIADIAKIYKSGELQFITDKKQLIQIMNTRSFSHLQSIISRYKEVTQGEKNFFKMIKSEFTGDLEAILSDYALAITNRPIYVSQQITKAFTSLGFRSEELTSYIVRNREASLMAKVKARFLERNKHTLEEVIKLNIFNYDFQNILLAIIA